MAISEAHGHAMGLWVLLRKGNNAVVVGKDITPYAITFSLSMGNST